MNGYFPALAKEHRVTTECVKVETCTTLMRSVLPVQWRDRGKVYSQIRSGIITGVISGIQS